MSKLKLKTKPYPHQIKAVRRALKQGSHAFFFDPRCGKSKAALDAIAVLNYRGKVQRVVIIAPLIALDVWVGQIEEHLAVPAVVLVTGEEPVYHLPKKDSNLRIYLVNYDKFSRRGEDEAYRNDYVARVERWQPDLIVLDESHRVKSSGAVRSQALWRMVRRLRSRNRTGHPWVYLLTGTPSPKGYIDIFSQYRILDQTIFGTARDDFTDEYCTFGRGKLKYTVLSYRRKKKLLRKVRERATIVTAKEANLAGREFFNTLSIELPDKARRVYNSMAEDLVAQIEGQTIEAANAGVRRMRLLQITGGFTTDSTKIHDAKLQATRDYLADLREQRESVVVYARFLPEVEALRRVCSKVGYRTAAITGDVPRRARSEAIRDFQSAVDGPRALVFQSEAGSLSIELTNAAETFFYSLPDSWETFFQCTRRIMGPNQPRPVRHTILLARGTVDIRVLDALRNKRDMHKEMMRSPRSFLFGL